MLKDCTVCGPDRQHSLVEDGTRIACDHCGLRSWPSEPIAVEDRSVPSVLSVWRAMSGAAIEASRAAEERTGPIDAGATLPPVVIVEDKS